MRSKSSKWIKVTLFTPEDAITIMEIFGREDYPINGDEKVIVDFGSNIGLSAAWFIAQSDDAFVYLFEPVEKNLKKLQQNLHKYGDRFELHETAVGLVDGEVSFGVEDSGRYGGIGRDTGETITVPCVDSNRTIDQILARHARIDILKVDIETLEQEVTSRITPAAAARIDRIYVEYPFHENPLATTHDMRRVGPMITHFVNGTTSGACKIP